MSLPTKKTICCPDCGAEIKFTLWQSINTEMEFAAEQIISGELFDVKCEKCGKEHRVDYPILFNDMIHYVSTDLVEETKQAFEKIPAIGLRIRIVTRQVELQEKTAIFSLGLDDRIIEIMKLILIAQLADDLEGRNLEDILFLEKDGKWYMELTIDGDRLRTEEIGHGIYTQIEQPLREKLKEDSEFVVDRQWALDFLDS